MKKRLFYTLVASIFGMLSTICMASGIRVFDIETNFEADRDVNGHRVVRINFEDDNEVNMNDDVVLLNILREVREANTKQIAVQWDDDPITLANNVIGLNKIALITISGIRDYTDIQYAKDFIVEIYNKSNDDFRSIFVASTENFDNIIQKLNTQKEIWEEVVRNLNH